MPLINRSFKYLVALVFMVFCSGTTLFGQDDFQNFIEAGAADASAIYREYSKPLFSGLNFAFSRGWYNTAKAHKPLGFDFSLNVSIAFVPDKERFYDAATVANQWLANGDNTRFASSESQYPTIVGPRNPAPVIEVRDPITGQFVEQFDGPTGLDYVNDIIPRAVPIAMPQFGIGLIKNTDLKFRFLPSIGGDDVKLKMFGIGLMHDIKQWIPGNSLIPVDISLLVAYSNIDFELRNIDDPQDDVFFELDAWTYNLLVSKELHIITFYGGLSYINSTNKFDVLGEYDVAASLAPIRDPVRLKFSDSGFGGTAGFRIKLAVLTINAEYTLQEYNTLRVGLGMSLR